MVPFLFDIINNIDNDFDNNDTYGDDGSDNMIMLL